MSDVQTETASNLVIKHQPENRMFDRDIKPASLPEIKRRIDEAYNFAANAEDYKYFRFRGSKQLLTPGKNYAELPSYAGKSPREIIESLPSGSKIIDVGCGYCQLGAEILGTVKNQPHDEEDFEIDDTETRPINKSVEVYGYDAQAQKGQDRLTRVKIGNIDDLSSDSFAGNPKDFDLVISSSVLYHLPDYWGAILRMANVLKPKGILLASTMPRVIVSEYDSKGPENSNGYLVTPDNGFFHYYRNRNVFDINGELIPPGQLVDFLNKLNPHFHLQYSVATGSMLGATTNGGQISGQRLSTDGNLDLSNMFYCLSQGNLGYIVAQTAEEKIKLQKMGYVNLHDRLPQR